MSGTVHQLQSVDRLEERTASRRAATAARLYVERRQRDRDFETLGPVFRDPTWDMTLDLFIAAEEGREVCVSSASIASCTPMTTGIRGIDRLVQSGVLRRYTDPADARRSLVTLTPEARRAMIVFIDRLDNPP